MLSQRLRFYNHIAWAENGNILLPYMAEIYIEA